MSFRTVGRNLANIPSEQLTKEPTMVNTHANKDFDYYEKQLEILPLLQGLSLSQIQGVLKGIELLVIDHIPMQLHYPSKLPLIVDEDGKELRVVI